MNIKFIIRKVLFSIIVLSLFSCFNSNGQSSKDDERFNFFGHWGIVQIGNASCNSCPEIAFTKMKMGKIFTRKLQEHFHWEFINDSSIEIIINSGDTNNFSERLLKAGKYNVNFSTGDFNNEKYLKVKLENSDKIPACTFMRKME